jgi:hypothetical protein
MDVAAKSLLEQGFQLAVRRKTFMGQRRLVIKRRKG